MKPFHRIFLASSIIALLVCSCTEHADVLVVGGGTGGVAAGIQSARSGARTLIVEETLWLGGMLTSAGVSAVDGNYNLRGGIFGEFCDSLASYYGGYDSLKTGWVSNILFEPHVGNDIFQKMVRNERLLSLASGAHEVEVERDGSGWKVSFTADGRRRTVLTDVLIDATELGDVAAACGVPYHVGMDSRSFTGESIAPEKGNDIIQDMTYVAVLKDYGPDADMTVPCPDGYDPEVYANSAFGPRNDKSHVGQILWSPEDMISYGRLPGGKYMINWPIEGNDFYANVVEANGEERAIAYRKAKDFTLGFVHYIQTEYGMKNLGIADDEFPTEDGLPFIPYHRESRRIDGEVLFTIDDAASPYSRKLYRTGIAVGDYAVDHHHHRHPQWQSLPELHFYPIPSFSVPLGSLLPAEEDNLIVAEKSISVSNIMNGATRLQPVVMQVGQAAGALAAIAATSRRSVKEVGVREVQSELLESGSYILPLLDIPVSDPHFAALQRIAATGILECEGRNEGWSNQTWFRAGDMMTWDELGNSFEEYWPGVYVREKGPVMLGQALSLVTTISGQDSWSSCSEEEWWQSLGLDNFDPERQISRLEFAVMLDAAADPFNAFGVDYDGELQRQDYISLVNPLIGTGGHGHVAVGASVPHGMIHAGPNNVSEGWDWCSGYHDSDSTVAGFAQNHLSGTGIADLGEILFMPVSSGLSENGCADSFDKRDETVLPGYYSVTLDSDIFAEMTAADRVAMHRYVWPDVSSDNAVLVDLAAAPKSIPTRKGCMDSGIEVIDGNTVRGFRLSDEWANGQKVYFTARFSEPFGDFALYEDGVQVSGMEVSGDDVKARFGFRGMKDVQVAIALSYTSEEGAMLNLNETAGKDFTSVRKAAESRWNGWLSRIEFEGIAPETDTIFYTAMYHAAMAPQLFSDADGSYLGADGKIRMAEDFVPYSIFSLWDTYRAVSPLYNIIDPRNCDYVNSLASIAEESGRLPVWHLAGHETDCMVGVHSVPVMADAALKSSSLWGGDIDDYRILSLIKKLDSQPVPGMDEIRRFGYVPADKVNWSVSRALEYCIDDHAVARLAESLDDTLTAVYYDTRSKGYRNYFDPDLHFMRGKLSDGSWRTPFDPSWSMHEEADYVEGNAWQYTWLVPHDVKGLISLFGSEEVFIAKLDSLFAADSFLNEGASADITGMIGQFAHGNEPSHHVPYLYAYAGEQYKTASLVRRICDEFYSTSADGLIGNEDCGQMSAWYIFSALGFYPVQPVDGIYVFGSPLAKRAVIHTVAGTDFIIETENNGPDNKYIRSVTLNGKPYDRWWISHEDIMKGGRLVFTMSSRPDGDCFKG